MADKSEMKIDKKSPVLLIAIIGVLVFLLIIGGVIAFLLVGGGKEQGATSGQAYNASSPKNRSNDIFSVGPMYPLEQFVVNLSSEDGSRFLKTTINLELSEQSLSAEIDKKKPIIRDIVIRVLSSKNYGDISTDRGKERLKDELVSKVNEVLKDGYVKNVYFTDFVVQ